MSGVEPDPTEAFYDEFWTGDVWSGHGLNHDEQQRFSAIKRLFDTHRLGGRILDVGCGRGAISAALAPYGTITGVDIVESAIVIARELFPELDFRRASVEDLNRTQAGSFDVVVSTEVIEHVPADEQLGFLNAIADALTPGGHVVLTTPRGELHDTWRTSINSEQPIEDWLTESELGALFERAGLTVVDRRRVMVYGITWWRRPLQLSVVRRLGSRFGRIGALIDRAGIYQVVLAHKPERDRSIIPERVGAERHG